MSKDKVLVLLPNQLFHSVKELEFDLIVFIEEYHFFSLYSFHKAKLAYHRATMKSFQKKLEKQGLKTLYIEHHQMEASLTHWDPYLIQQDWTQVSFFSPYDNWVQKALDQWSDRVEINYLTSPMMINSEHSYFDNQFKKNKTILHHHFYKAQRKKWKVLVDGQGEPLGGQWSFDHDNRKKYPKNKTPPDMTTLGERVEWNEAILYVEAHFPDNPGSLTTHSTYPIDHESAHKWLKDFLKHRFIEFGDYEDAILSEESWINHSVISPMLNTGLIEPKEVISTSIEYAAQQNIPINSLEGFIRQILGWREFMMGLYLTVGSEMRTRNYWGFDRSMPEAFYSGTTGIPPIDQTIKKLLGTAYNHHIERLMVLGNFMLLCEIKPDDVYQWFMEMYIDAYDWVMVPNIYGMSQFSDGGIFATKPYIAGSNYILKMSNYPKGEWTEIWNALYWRFISKHADFFSKNFRTKMIYANWQRQAPEKQQKHLKIAEDYLQRLYQ